MGRGPRPDAPAIADRTGRRLQRDWDPAPGLSQQALADPALLVIDIQTTGLHRPLAAQISALNPDGTIVFNELLNPQAAFEPEASALHGLTSHNTQHAAIFSDLVAFYSVAYDNSPKAHDPTGSPHHGGPSRHCRPPRRRSGGPEGIAMRGAQARAHSMALPAGAGTVTDDLDALSGLVRRRLSRRPSRWKPLRPESSHR